MKQKIKKISDLSVSQICKMIKHDEILDDEETTLGEWVNDSLKNISLDDRSILIQEAIRRAVRKYGEDGLTADEITKITGFSRATVEKHLKTLCGLREIYSVKKGKRLILYYPNGKPLWGIGTKKFEWGNTILEVTVAKGPKDKLFFHILEKRYSILEGERAEGGILLPIEGLNDFIEGLRELANKLEVIK